MLNLIAFLCGAALMSLEIVAARVLAPALGNSIFVWGSVISAVMVALSAGYWLGGQAADRLGARRVLPPVIAGAGLLTVLAPAVADATLPWAADLGPRMGSLTAAALIFFAPSLLLAMVSPLAVSLAATSGLARIGRSAGGLYAVSTAGSIVGTIGTAFWLIPMLSLEPLIVAVGFLLFLTALGALALPDAERTAVRRRPTLALVAATVLIGTAGAVAGMIVLSRTAPTDETNAFGERVLFRQDTQYHRITVTEADGVRHLRFDRSNQSAIDLADACTSRIRYPDYLHLALAAKPDAKRVLVLGLGGGVVSKRYWRDYPQLTVDSVEIDPVVIDVSKRYFGLPEDERLRVFNQDARRFVQTSSEAYDIVIVDCYYADSLPYHLTTAEFFREVEARLTPGGVVACNVIGSVSGERSRLFRSMYRTAGGVFDHLWVFPIGISRDGAKEANRNIIVLGTDADIPRAELLSRIEDRVGGRVSVPGFAGFGADLHTGIVPVADVPLLTDAHAPTDSLIQVQ